MYVDDEYTNDELNNEYYNHPIGMTDNIKFGTINKTSRRYRHISIYDYDIKGTKKNRR